MALTVKPTVRISELPERRCAYKKCGRKFQPVKAHQKYHSPQCRWFDWDEKHPRLQETK